MKPIENFDLVTEAGEFRRLPAGIYGAVITNVVDDPEEERLEVYWDITKGEYKGYFKNLVDAGLKDSSRTFKYYKVDKVKGTSTLGFFKAFITAIEKTNPNFKWDWDEKKLIGKNVIVVVGEEEYEDKDGNIKVASKAVEFRSLEAYKDGKIKVPELKKLPPKEKVVEPTTPLEIDDDDLPF
jgi:hypothetical protein